MEWGRRSLIQVLLVSSSLLTACTGQMAFTFCDNVSSISGTEISIKFSESQQPGLQCSCSIIPTMGYNTLLSLSMRLDQVNEENPSGSSNSNSNSNVTCEPFTAIIWGQGYQVAQCARKEGDNNMNTNGDMVIEEDSTFLVRTSGEPVSVTLHNHKLWPISANVNVKVIEGHVNIQCQPVETSMVWDADTCPCDRNMVHLGAGINPDDFAHGNVSDSSTGAIVGVVVVVIFLLILALIAGVWWWRKKRQPAGEKDLERVTADNAAYAGSTTASRASGIDRTAETPQQPQYTNVPGPGPYPNEELNLSLQTAPNKQQGSVDSGVYSMPADKHPNHQGNNNYSNVPLGPDQMYNPMLAKQPSTHSLTGAGALHGSVDHLNPADVVYAQPNKKDKRGVDRNPAPTRSASHDALNQRPDGAPVGGNMAGQKSRSHNASAASLSVETDV